MPLAKFPRIPTSQYVAAAYATMSIQIFHRDKAAADALALSSGRINWSVGSGRLTHVPRRAPHQRRIARNPEEELPVWRLMMRAVLIRRRRGTGCRRRLLGGLANGGIG
jgi:hypothetical protein